LDDNKNLQIFVRKVNQSKSIT